MKNAEDVYRSFYDSLSSSTSSVIMSSLDEEKQESNKEPGVYLKGNSRGHFNSRFNNRPPLSLHPPVSMETERSGLLSKAEEIHYRKSKRILRIFQKARVEMRKRTDAEVYLIQRQGNETIGERAIKSARDKNTLPEVTSKRRHETKMSHFLPKLTDRDWSAASSSRSDVFQSDKTFVSVVEDDEELRAVRGRKRSVLAWSTCVFPAILLDHRESRSITSVNLRHERNERHKDMKRNSFKPTEYAAEMSCSVQHELSAERPISPKLYPSHHGW